jgi:hypothetical protein
VNKYAVFAVILAFILLVVVKVFLVGYRNKKPALLAQVFE